MAKKTWIKVKRGILDPKHRDKLGIRLWLYLYLLDNADWETGIIYDWKDKDHGEDSSMPWRTLQGWRQQLEKDGYITCHIRQYNIDIEVHNWTNPREYSGKVYNKKKSVYAKPRTPNTGQVVSKQRTPSYNSHNTNKNPQTTEDVVKQKAIFEALTEIGIKGKTIQQQLSTLEHVTPDYIRVMATHPKASKGKGMLITIIRDGDPVPEDASKKKSYIDGKFSEFVEH